MMDAGLDAEALRSRVSLQLYRRSVCECESPGVLSSAVGWHELVHAQQSCAASS